MIAAGQLLMAVGLAGLWLLPADAPIAARGARHGARRRRRILHRPPDHRPRHGPCPGRTGRDRQRGHQHRPAGRRLPRRRDLRRPARRARTSWTGSASGLGTTAIVLLILIAASPARCGPARTIAHAQPRRPSTRIRSRTPCNSYPRHPRPRRQRKGSPETFTSARCTPARLPHGSSAALVRFTPGARTNWHSHPLGQTLHCTDGTGLVATRDGSVILMRPGDTVHTPPGRNTGTAPPGTA